MKTALGLLAIALWVLVFVLSSHYQETRGPLHSPAQAVAYVQSVSELLCRPADRKGEYDCGPGLQVSIKVYEDLPEIHIPTATIDSEAGTALTNSLLKDLGLNTGFEPFFLDKTIAKNDSAGVFAVWDSSGIRIKQQGKH